ncbi:protein APCDD1-like [Tubulanus polymorphus]|uniref:protein APCDD1-like n=1 Tax=Tubulanus polymorphus TaxID=672921 RepID=UPI003DA48952
MAMALSLMLMVTLSVFFSCILTTETRKFGTEEAGREDTCDRIINHIPHCHVKSAVPPEITGTWVSKRCEIRPGPEYLLRKYIFRNSTSFEAHQYYYEDSQCSRPLYGAIARGSVKMLRESWTVPGGTEAEYYLSQVTIIPYQPDMAEKLQRKFNQTCPKMFAGKFWRPFKTYDIFNYVESRKPGRVIILDHDCTHAVGFTMHELQLLRLEVRSHFHPFYVRRELYLGCLHTDKNQRQQYRPTCYQEPLLSHETMGCHVCRRILNSDDFLPPELHRRPVETKVDLQGEWVSYRCETRPMGMFLTRRFTFENDRKTWQGHYYYFMDPLCKIKAFTLFAWGTYYAGRRSSVVENTWNYDFKVAHLSVTPNDKSVVEHLTRDRSKEGCGRAGQWEIGIQQDITNSRGCLALGLKVPHIEYEILNIEKVHEKQWLYFGQRPSDGSSPITPRQRPTSFQFPMVQCGRVESRNRIGRQGQTAAMLATDERRSNTAAAGIGILSMTGILIPLIMTFTLLLS